MSESVTVVIPAWNRPRRLQQAIRSVLGQDHAPFSLVVVDDASDADLGEAKSLVEKSGHEWLRFDQNRGPAAARNVGAAVVESRWIMFLDSDDLWLPGKLSRQLEWHRANPGCRISQVREKWIRNGAAVHKPRHLEQAGGDLFQGSLERCLVGPSCVAIRSDLWEESGGFDPWYRACEDYELWLRITVSDSVGLVDGDFLVEKHGGNPDQLSVSIPALDRFRFVALAGFLQSHPGLEKQKRVAVIEELKRKARILALGAGKRNRKEWKEFYETCQFPLTAAELEIARQFGEELVS